MLSSQSLAPQSDDRLDQAVAEFLVAKESGQPVDDAALVARYPEQADELARFVADHERLCELARPLRELLSTDASTARPPSGDDLTIALPADGSVPSGQRPSDLQTSSAIGDA
jgi:hypothetical protein